jgi:hypothetical protein
MPVLRKSVHNVSALWTDSNYFVEDNMKVFLSWSGDISHKVAMTFREWIPLVIQSIAPYVSSEDIYKGARWSTDIAKELEDTTFGILCVTKENINAPWLNFEAGALSITMDKSFVSPFLFDIKRSEVNGPMLQFQSTIFEKEDIRKLMYSLNKACKEGPLADGRLEIIFNLFYPSLESELNKIKEIKHEQSSEEDQLPSEDNSTILEEILELTRMNQKLIRNPEGVFVETVAKINEALSNLQHKITRSFNLNNRRSRYRNIPPMFFEEILYSPEYNKTSYLGVQMALSFFRDDFPWIYDAGNDLIRILKSRKSRQEKYNAIDRFNNILELLFKHPVFREMQMDNKNMRVMYRELPQLFKRSLDMIEEN